VRLAFAVAAHLEPEILIVDEVLAVGDAQFQKKCMGKMQEVSQGGRTVLFVSHNMASVTSLTDRIILMNKGSVQFSGATDQGIQQYLADAESTKGFYHSKKSDATKPFLSKIVINSEPGEATHVSGNEMEITFEIKHSKPITSACFSFQIVNQSQQPVIHCWIYDANDPQKRICRNSGTTVLKCRIPKLSLNIGGYSLSTYLSEPPGGETFENLEGVCSFDVEILGEQTLFGWRSDACAYFENYTWTNR
jgi:lipopolysaccharide transport system ATP-binding protein